jgi:hypothetical protein
MSNGLASVNKIIQGITPDITSLEEFILMLQEISKNRARRYLFYYILIRDKRSRIKPWQIKALIKSRVTFLGSKLKEKLKTSIKNGPLEPEFLEKPSRVISDEVDAK